MKLSSTELQNNSDPRSQPKDLAGPPKPKKERSGKAGMRYVRLKTQDDVTIEGLVAEKPLASIADGKVLKFNKCYLVEDIGKVGRLWVNRAFTGDDDLPNDLPRFEHIRELEDDPKIPEAPVLSVEKLRKWYPLKRGFF